MAIFHVKTELFPAPEHFWAGKASPLSILALQLMILTQDGNLFGQNNDKDLFFFRDGNIPRVRPATFSAWRALVGLGDSTSPYFNVPFLPSIRDDEEGGIAGSIRGGVTAHLTTLSRRSKLHLLDSHGYINWGSVYIGDSRRDSPLICSLYRSDIPESIVVPRGFQIYDETFRANGGLRARMEFIAQHGFPAVYQADIPIRGIRRLLLQTTNHRSAHDWAESYALTARQLETGVDTCESDYQELVESLRKAQEKKGAEEGETRVTKKGKIEQKVNIKINFKNDLTI